MPACLLLFQTSEVPDRQERIVEMSDTGDRSMQTVVESLVGQIVVKEIGEETGLSCVTTTLYDLIAAMHDIVGSNDDTVVVATIDHMLRAGRIVFLDNDMVLDRIQGLMFC
jgi:hypothetical protein